VSTNNEEKDDEISNKSSFISTLFRQKPKSAIGGIDEESYDRVNDELIT